MAEEKQPKEDIKYIVRVANTDLDGQRDTITALRKIKGVSYSFANAICANAGVDGSKKTGKLSDAEVKKLEDSILKAAEIFPEWLLNRRKDLEDNKSKHLVTTDLTFSKESDVRLMKKIKSYKGTRHMFNVPVRGQRTRSNFRKNKGKALGVAKAKKGKTG